MPDAPGLELILAEINRSHPGAVLDTSFDREQPALIVNPARLLEVLGWLRETPGQEYTFLSSLHGVDYFPHSPRFAVHYELLNRERHERLRVKAVIPDPGTSGAGSTEVEQPHVGDPIVPQDQRESEIATPPVTRSADTEQSTGSANGDDGLSHAGVPAAYAATPAVRGEDDPGPVTGPEPDADGLRTKVIDGQPVPVIPSCVHLYPTADFQEREVYDFFGIVFDGHPDLRRILMPEDYVGWPQRRDFPVGGEPVIFTKDEVENPGWWK